MVLLSVHCGLNLGLFVVGSLGLLLLGLLYWIGGLCLVVCHLFYCFWLWVFGSWFALAY